MISPVKVWRNQKFTARMIGKTGTIISFTIIRVPPADFGYQAPYAIALVRLDDGQTLAVQVTDCVFEDIQIGKKVRTTVRKTIQAETDAVIPYGIKATLV